MKRIQQTRSPDRPHDKGLRPPTGQQRSHRLLAAGILARYLEKQGPNLATLLAWNALFAFFPITLITITGASLLPGGEHAGSLLARTVAALFGRQNQGAILTALTHYRADAGILVVVSIAGLFWSGISLFGMMDQVLNLLYGKEPRGVLRQKLMAAAMVILFAVLLIIALATSSALSLMRDIAGVPPSLRDSSLPLLVQIVTGVLDGLLLFVAIYRVIPRVRQSWSQVLGAALTAACLFEAVTLAFPLYFRLSHGFDSYGTTFALLFLLLAYAMLLGQITVIGGAVGGELYDRSTAGGTRLRRGKQQRAVGHPGVGVGAAASASTPEPVSSSPTTETGVPRASAKRPAAHKSHRHKRK